MFAHTPLVTRLQAELPRSGVQQKPPVAQARPPPQVHWPPQPSLLGPQLDPSQRGQQPPGQPEPMQTPAPEQVVPLAHGVTTLQR